MSKGTILYINSFNTGSTGNIMVALSKIANQYGFTTYLAYPSSRTNNKKELANSIKIGNILDRNIHLKLSYYTGYNGCFSIFSTKRFLKKIDKIKPDIIHLHNLHNCYVNIKLLFDYIKEKNVSVIWTLHDCWAFTGQCVHFLTVKCEKWKKECYDCPQIKKYPASFVDKTREMFLLKKKWFTGVTNLKIVTPSLWLANLVRQSFLSEYPVIVINNGVDLNIFKPLKSNFREKYKLENKFIVLGVAYSWSERKGLHIFMELAKYLDERFKIVLVGLTEDQIKKIHTNNIIGLPRTNNSKELAEIYSAADVFVNPTLEDNFPTTNLEALACGTPVVTFDTGGSPECVDESCGVVVEKGNFNRLIEAIVQIRLNLFNKDCCVNRARKFDKNRYSEYIELYSRL